MRSKIISGATAVLVLAFFFLPWFSVSYNGRALGQFSGYQLAVGVGDYAIDGLNGRSALFLIPLSAIVVLLLLVITYSKPSWRIFGVVGEFVAAGVATVVLTWQFAAGGINALLTYETELGLMLTILSIVVLSAKAALDLFNSLHVIGKSSEGEAALTQQPSQIDGHDEQMKAKTAVVKLPPSLSAETEMSPKKKTTRSLYKIGVLADDPSIEAWLIVKEGPNSGEKFRLVPPMRIGRDVGNDIIIDDRSISGYHAVVREDGGVFHIQDLNSTNGIYLENQTNHNWLQVPATTLVDEMRIKMGRTVFEVVIGE